MKILNRDYPIPAELKSEDVYDLHFLFDNEKEAIDYIVSEYNVSRREVIKELYRENFMRKDFGKELYLRTYTIRGKNETFIAAELMSGEYLLYETY